MARDIDASFRENSIERSGRSDTRRVQPRGKAITTSTSSTDISLLQRADEGGVRSDTPEHVREARAASGGEKTIQQPDIPGRRYPSVITDSERETLYDIGRFRTVAVRDLLEQKYRGDQPQMDRDLRSLEAQGLVQRRTVWTGGKRDRLTVLVLTSPGKEAVERDFAQASGQRLYRGFVKPAEVLHDAAIYRMYHAEIAQIEKAGGRIRRVVLDYELKQRLYSVLAKAKSLPALEYARKQAAVARENGLKVVGGRIPLPDLRIEYDTPEGETWHIDLELATTHYRGSQVRMKAEAGFKMYAPADSVSRLSSVWEGPEITGPILSL